MPIEYRVDHERRLVWAKGRGILTDEDVFGYQREVWSRPDVSGYSELADMTEVERIDLPTVDRIRDLARLSAGMDNLWTGSKFSVVAPGDLALGLGRMYEMYRGLQPQSTKEVRIFRTLPEALAFLGVDAKGFPKEG